VRSDLPKGVIDRQAPDLVNGQLYRSCYLMILAEGSPGP
jgi:hypothetical protein